MSWDVYIELEPCKTCKRVAEYIDVGNMTYNVSPMYYLAWDKKRGLRDLDKMQAEKAIPLLKEATAAMEKFPEMYRKLNPKNGWGNYESALQFLKTIQIKCEEYPDGVLKIS